MSLFAIFMLSMLTLLLVLHFVLSPRDTLVELKLVFDWRMIRRGTRIRTSQVQFSIARLLSWMTIIAIYFWLIRGSHFYLRDSIYIGTTFLSTWTCK